MYLFMSDLAIVVRTTVATSASKLIIRSTFFFFIFRIATEEPPKPFWPSSFSILLCSINLEEKWMRKIKFYWTRSSNEFHQKYQTTFWDWCIKICMNVIQIQLWPENVDKLMIMIDIPKFLRSNKQTWSKELINGSRHTFMQVIIIGRKSWSKIKDIGIAAAQIHHRLYLPLLYGKGHQDLYH